MFKSCLIASYKHVDPVWGLPLPYRRTGLGVESCDATPIIIHLADRLRANRHDQRQPLRKAGSMAEMAHHRLGICGVGEVLLPDLLAAAEIIGTEIRRLIRFATTPIRVHRVHLVARKHGQSIGHVIVVRGCIARLPDPLPILQAVMICATFFVLEDEGVIVGEHGHEVPELIIGGELPQDIAVASIHADDRKGSSTSVSLRLGNHHPIVHSHPRDVRS
mmetsp:Transcript_37288/g.78204  ORF Transcript_37288/g.78204 Transcript_37288/m.78204 type:complete len:219 (-) Transcript_37288:519-1175(-)